MHFVFVISLQFLKSLYFYNIIRIKGELYENCYLISRNRISL